MSSDTPADVAEVNLVDLTRLVDKINKSRLEAYNDARDAPLEVGYYVDPWDDRPEFPYLPQTGEQTCACGNIFCRPVSCKLCAGKCLGENYKRLIDEVCGNPYHSCCCECDGCYYHPDQYKLPDPIPVAVSCLSSCSCATATVPAITTVIATADK